MTMLVRSLELVGFLGIAKAWQSVGWAFAVHFHFHRAFAFGAGFAKDGESGQSFVVNLSNQIGFAGIFLLPDLADLEFARGHMTNVVRIGRPVNISARVDSLGQHVGAFWCGGAARGNRFDVEVAEVGAHGTERTAKARRLSGRRSGKRGRSKQCPHSGSLKARL